MLTLEGVTKRFGKRTALDALSAEIPDGVIYGLLGPNGAGKTTLLRLVTGLLPPSAGRIVLLGGHAPGSIEAQRGLGYMPQELALYPGLSPRENVRFFGRLYGLSETEVSRRADELLDLVELGERRNDPVSELSGGMARRAMLASALVHDPKFLILDEPTAGVDPVLRVRFWDWFARLAGRGTTILLTTHHIAEARGCHEILFLRGGRLLDQGRPDDLVARYGAADLESAFVRAVDAKGERE